MKKAVLFDLGNTLVKYYTRTESPGVLKEAIGEVRTFLRGAELLRAPPEAMWEQVEQERHEADDYRVRPLEDRLARIFQLDVRALPADLVMALCRSFLKPIFALAQRYDDAVPTLEELRSRGLKLGIISNLPWGSPSEPWREEVARHDLTERVDAVVFCRDVGWRKPAKQIFEHACARLTVKPQECLFIGDDPCWDLAGPRSFGMDAVILDRQSRRSEPGDSTIGSLHELLSSSRPWSLR